MKFETASGNVMSARQAIHDCFISDIKAIDYVELANGSGVQFTAKGGDNCTMDHCDKGKVQLVLAKVQKNNPAAHAWALHAYAPEDTISQLAAECLIVPHIMFAMNTRQFKPLRIPFFVRLCKAALRDARLDAWAGKRHPHSRAELAAICQCSEEEYATSWRFVYYNIKDKIIDLDAIALPPVARLIWAIVDKGNGVDGAHDDFLKAVAQN